MFAVASPFNRLVLCFAKKNVETALVKYFCYQYKSVIEVKEVHLPNSSGLNISFLLECCEDDACLCKWMNVDIRTRTR